MLDNILANTPNVKKPMMECELHDGEKIMVSLHHNVRVINRKEFVFDGMMKKLFLEMLLSFLFVFLLFFLV
jgi:hypothetical protein